MKIRKGFVSNSSSSSFVCDVTGEEVQGMDLCLSEAEMYCCEEGHYFLEEFLVGTISEEEEEENEDLRYELPKKYCPICTFKHIMESDMALYVEKRYGIKSTEVFDYMKKKNSRLRKLRSIYWFEYLEKTKNVSKMALEEEIRSQFSSLESLENYIRS